MAQLSWTRSGLVNRMLAFCMSVSSDSVPRRYTREMYKKRRLPSASNLEPIQLNVQNFIAAPHMCRSIFSRPILLSIETVPSIRFFNSFYLRRGFSAKKKIISVTSNRAVEKCRKLFACNKKNPDFCSSGYHPRHISR